MGFPIIRELNESRAQRFNAYSAEAASAAEIERKLDYAQGLYSCLIPSKHRSH